jgi:CHAT domain-containing protein
MRLEVALTMLEQRRDSVRMEPRRAAVFETARSVVDRITALELASGRTTDALAYLDRGRESLATVGGRRNARENGGVSGPPGEVALEFALIGDTLLAWTVSGRQVELSRTRIDTVRLIRTIESLRARLEASAGVGELLPDLARLYETLLRPVADRLGSRGTPLVIVADGAVASVPFAALFDARRKRFLVEDHPLRFVPSLRAARRRSRRPAAGDVALFIADPAFEPGAHPGFERLKGAAAEVREVTGAYGTPQVLSGRGATAAVLRAALARAGIAHYAGHAVFNDDHPERSYLLLAPLAGEPRSGTLQAGEIAQLDLQHLALVVLSACQTVRTGPGRAAGLSGLAGAFIAAGAGGAVGSLWEVDDERTRPLMVAFHRAYRATGNGPTALRAAQLELLNRRDETLRSPATWAAFRYVGS